MTFGGPALMARTSTFALSPLRAALLGLLATEPDDGLSTAHVIDLLWKPGPSSRLRHRISQLIYALNRELPEKVVVRERHRLYLSRTVVTDYQQFEAAMLNGRLMEAEALLSRGFLSQLAEPPSEAFLEWLDRTKLKLRDRVRRDAAGEWTLLMDRSRWTQAVEAARVLLALNVYDEGALRMLMRAEAMAGRVGEAKAVFDSFVERSESDKRDWVPQAETLSLVDEIRDLPFGVSTKFAAQALDRSPLIGRSDELDELSTAMLPRPGDGLRLVVIRGERGTGKTRLLEESLATDLLNGIPVLRYPTSKTERRAFLNSVLGTLASSNADSDLSGLTAPWHATMLDLLAEPHAGTALPFEPPAVEPDQGHQRYVDIIRQALVAVAGNEPIIFVIDDCHRVDEEFAEVLLYLVQRWPSPRLAVTLAIGTEGVREKDPFIRLLGDSLLECDVAEFTLDELTRDAAAELVDTVAEGRIEEGERDRIVELSDQNPLFLLKLSKLSLAGSRLPNLDPDDFVSVPQSISDVFSGRLAELDDDTERTLQLLSVMGRPLGVGTLSKLSDRSRDSCVDALDILQQSRLVRRAASGFAVRYELIRHAVYDRMSVPRRTWVHGRVASHLDDANTSATPAELAIHYLHAGIPIKALRYVLAGASAAEKSGALAEATRLFALARRYTHDPRTHARVAERLARLHYVRRDIEDGPERLAEAAHELRKVHRHQSALVAEIQRVDLLASSGACSPQEALAFIRELGHTAELAKHWKAAARAIDLELHIHRREGEGLEADALAAHARKLLDQVEPESRGAIHASLALHHQGDFGEGLGHAREAIAIARRNRSPDELLRALACLVAIQGARGLMTDPETSSAVEEAESLARDLDDFVEHYNLLVSAGGGYRAVGHLDQARSWFVRAGEVLANVRTWESHVFLECKLGELELEERELGEAAAHFARARRLWQPGMGRHLGIISHSGVGLTALRMGELSRAREMAGHISRPPARWFEDPWVFALFQAHLCELRGVTGDGADAVSVIADQIEASQPANWARLKFEEALLRLRHSLPQRDEIARTAADAASDLGIDRRMTALKAAQERARRRGMPG